MRRTSQILACICIAMLVAVSVAQAAREYPHPDTYIPSIQTIEKHKKRFNDPSPYLTTFGLKQVLPKDMYAKLIFPVEKMKSDWAEVVGFKAPDVVGKIAPGIKPGKYTYKDVQNNPAFKQLMYPDLIKRIKPGGPPFAGNIPEFEIIPTRQYYYSSPIADMTKQNTGKAKLDAKGFLVAKSWENGFPFPRPSGAQKAAQIMYNVEKKFFNFGTDAYFLARFTGVNKNMKMDMDGLYEVRQLRLAGRAFLKPYGYYDNRAKERGEFKAYAFNHNAPRDIAGVVQTALFYREPDKADNLLLYLPSMRRVRKMTSTDTQDPVMGQDIIYDDSEGFGQKLSPTRYPYKFEVVEEREFLVPAPTLDGAEYITSPDKGLEIRNVRMERRPIYVVKLTQLDPNYVYGHRIFYIDKETFAQYHVANYDRKGRLYRTLDFHYAFEPQMGMLHWGGSVVLYADHVDLHSGIQQPYLLPAVFERRDVNIEQFMKAK
ncbi:MAG: hypothetical protein A4E65_03061 [Syntrophorhabdus sp. PtaU1.Bin153]|nr:MAG: hypothetical protein A4E65_03061 [Syntrophorhabdus sp. PtaU1.Bin153]